MKIEFDTGEYRRSHFKEPSRTERGVWAFKVILIDGERTKNSENLLSQSNSTIGEAKKAIRSFLSLKLPEAKWVIISIQP